MHGVYEGYIGPFIQRRYIVHVKFSAAAFYVSHSKLMNYFNSKVVLVNLQPLALILVLWDLQWFKSTNTDIYWHQYIIYAMTYTRCSLSAIQNSSSSVMNWFIIDKPLMATHVTLIVVLHVKAHQEPIVENKAYWWLEKGTWICYWQ